MEAGSRGASGIVIAAILAVVGFVTAFTIATLGFIDTQATRGVQAELSQRSGTDLAFRATLPLGMSGVRQDEQVRAAVQRTFAPADVTFDVVRTLQAPMSVRLNPEDPEGTSRSVLAMSIADLTDRADLTTGAFAVLPTEVAVQADAASALGLDVGDDVLLDGVEFVVSGTWRPSDPFDPRWDGEQLVVTGFTEYFGPFVVEESGWDRLETSPEVAWTLVPDDFDQVMASNLGSVIGAWDRIQNDWRGQVDGMEDLTYHRNLSETLLQLRSQVDGLRSIEPVIFTLLGAIALVTLAELTRLLVAVRATSSALYWARGRSTASIAVRIAAQVGLASLAAALVGGAAVVGSFIALGEADTVARLGVPAWAIPAALIVGAVGLSARRAAATSGLARTTARSHRGRRLAVPGAVILVVLAAALSVWQLRLYGSPLTPTATGFGGADPVAVAAPAAALVALVLLALAAFPAIARITERSVRGRSIPSQLAARTLTSRRAIVTAPLVVVALAMGSVTLAASYSATWSRSFDQTAALRAGADLHANLRTTGISVAAEDTVAEVPGVAAIAPLEVQPLSIGGESGSIVAVAPDAVATIATTADGAFDREAIAELIRVEAPGPVIPAGSSQVTLTITIVGSASPPAAALQVVDSVGRLREVPFSTATIGDSPDGLAYVADVEALAASGDWRVVAIDWEFTPQDPDGIRARLALNGLVAEVQGATVELDVDQFWMADNPGAQSAQQQTDSAGRGLTLAEGGTSARMTPSLDGDSSDRVAPALVVSQLLAASLDVGVGDSLAFPVQDGIEPIRGTVAAIVPAIPGAPTESAVLLDLGVIQHFQLRTTAQAADPRDLWIASDNAEQARAGIRSALPANTRITASDDPAGRQVLGSAATALWASAILSIIVAGIGVSASARARLREGRGDVAALRALGLRTREQGAIVSTELAIVLVIGVCAGLVAGVIVSVLTVPQLARAAVTEPYFSLNTDFLVDWVGLVAGAGMLIVALVAITLVMGSRVGQIARTALPGKRS